MVNWETQLHCSRDFGYDRTCSCSTIVNQVIKLFPTKNYGKYCTLSVVFLTSNLCKHAVASVKAITEIGNIDDAHASVKGLKETATIEALFEKKGCGKIKYWHMQHSKTKTKYILHTQYC